MAQMHQNISIKQLACRHVPCAAELHIMHVLCSLPIQAQGSLGESSRGACKLCGGIGHRDKQCTNFLTGHSAAAGVNTLEAAAALGVQVAPSMGLLPDPGDLGDLSDLSSDSDSGSDSGSSDNGRDRKKDSKKRKRSKASGGNSRVSMLMRQPDNCTNVYCVKTPP